MPDDNTLQTERREKRGERREKREEGPITKYHIVTGVCNGIFVSGGIVHKKDKREVGKSIRPLRMTRRADILKLQIGWIRFDIDNITQRFIFVG